MSRVIETKTIRGTEYVTLKAHREALTENTFDARKKEVGYGISSYRAEVIVSVRDHEGDLQEKSRATRSFTDISLAIHWTKTILIERASDGDRVLSVLYESKERRLNDDGSPIDVVTSLFSLWR